jgi:hypothetical protein
VFTANVWNIDLPVRGAANYTSDPWCFYAQPNYANLHWEVQPGRYTSDMQWTGARSFKRGRC